MTTHIALTASPAKSPAMLRQYHITEDNHLGMSALDDEEWHYTEEQTVELYWKQMTQPQSMSFFGSCIFDA